MRIFLTGANGWIGSAIAQELLARGHQVEGLVRSSAKAAALAAKSITPVVGSLEDLAVLKRGAERADGVIHTAFGLDLSQIGELARQDRNAIQAFGEVYRDSERPILVTGGFLPGPKASELDRPSVDPNFPRASEQTAFELADQGVHANAVRNPRSVHGQGEMHGFVPMLAAVARDKRVSAYIEDGANRWPAVHRLDSARVYASAIERGARGEAYHAVAEEGVAFRAIAEAIGRQLGLPAVSLTKDEGDDHFGPLAQWVAGDGPVSNEWTRATLGWTPKEVGIVEDIERADYSAVS